MVNAPDKMMHAANRVFLIAAVSIITGIGAGTGILIYKRSASLDKKRLEEENKFFIYLKPAPPFSRETVSNSSSENPEALPPKRPVSRSLDMESEYISPRDKD